MILLYIVVLLFSFYLLAKVCDEYFVFSLDKIADKLKLSHEASGATLMAVGSSAPELFVSLIAILKPGNHGAMGAGTIVGSAIFNILVIIGASLYVRRAKITWQPVARDMFFYALSIVILLISFADGKITLLEACSFVLVYILYVVAVVNWKKIFKYNDDVIEEMVEEAEKEDKKIFGFFAKFTTDILNLTFPAKKNFYGVFFMSLVWIVALSWVLVESGVGLAHLLGIPEVIIGLTILAAGTSVPDLMSSIIVAKQGRSGMAISNGIGSNIFDILFCLGLPWVISILLKGENVVVDTSNLTNSVILLFATVICIVFLFVVRKWKLGRKSGIFLILLYVAYLAWLISGVYN